MMPFAKYILFVFSFLLFSGEMSYTVVMDDGVKISESEEGVLLHGFSVLEELFVSGLEKALNAEGQEKNGHSLWIKSIWNESGIGENQVTGLIEKYTAFLSGRHLHGFYIYFLKKLLL